MKNYSSIWLKMSIHGKAKNRGIYLIPTHWRRGKSAYKNKSCECLNFLAKSEDTRVSWNTARRRTPASPRSQQHLHRDRTVLWWGWEELNWSVATEINWPFSPTKCCKCYESLYKMTTWLEFHKETYCRRQDCNQVLNWSKLHRNALHNF